MSTSSTQQDLNYLTCSQAARILHCKPYRILRAIEKGKLVAFQPIKDGAYLIRPNDLHAFVEAAQAGAAA